MGPRARAFVRVCGSGILHLGVVTDAQFWLTYVLHNVCTGINGSTIWWEFESINVSTRADVNYKQNVYIRATTKGEPSR